MNEWIPVQDEIPPYGFTVDAIYHLRPRPIKAKRVLSEVTGQLEWFDVDEQCYLSRVTHWKYQQEQNDITT